MPTAVLTLPGVGRSGPSPPKCLRRKPKPSSSQLSTQPLACEKAPTVTLSLGFAAPSPPKKSGVKGKPGVGGGLILRPIPIGQGQVWIADGVPQFLFEQL